MRSLAWRRGRVGTARRVRVCDRYLARGASAPCNSLHLDKSRARDHLLELAAHAQQQGTAASCRERQFIHIGASARRRDRGTGTCHRSEPRRACRSAPDVAHREGARRANGDRRRRGWRSHATHVSWPQVSGGGALLLARDRRLTANEVFKILNASMQQPVPRAACSRP